jgi:WD40 repeat protein
LHSGSKNKSHDKSPETDASLIVTLQDLERKLTLNDTESIADPTRFLSVNLKDDQETKENLEPKSASDSPDLPALEYDSEDLSTTEFLIPEVTSNKHILNIDKDLDLEPIEIRTVAGLKGEVCQSEVLLDPEEYRHIFDDQYLADFDQDIDGGQDGPETLEELDLIQAFDGMGIGEIENEELREGAAPPQALPLMGAPAYQGLGQTLYCLPCNAGREEDPFSIDVDWDMDPAVLESLRQEAENDFDQDDTLSKRDMQKLLQHVMEGQNVLPSEKGIGNSQVEDEMETYDNDQEIEYTVSSRAEALKQAEPLVNGFYNKVERQCFGHKDKIFGIAMSPCGNFCATASQDSTVCVWNVDKNSLLSTIVGSKDHESLRVAWASDKWAKGVYINNKGDVKQQFIRKDGDLILGTAGADGFAKVWQSLDGAKSWVEIGSLDHLIDKKKGSDNNRLESIEEESEEQNAMNEKEEVDGTEVYALQFIDDWNSLPTFVSHDERSSLGVIMTSSEDFIHIWQVISPSRLDAQNLMVTRAQDDIECNTNIAKIMDIKFTHLEHGFGGVFVHINIGNKQLDKPEWTKTNSSNIVTNKRVFGGDRNPDKLVYVFDAAQCPTNGLVGAALSDGTLRLVNGRGTCVTILQLPGCDSHLTSFSWNKTGHRLASCVATGHVVLWDIDYGDGKGAVKPVCRAVLEGGHSAGRPLFGACYFGGDNEVRATIQ